MLRFAPAFAATLVLTLLATPAAALDTPPVCQALHGLADAARTSGQPQRIAVDASGCRPAGPFCDATRGEAVDLLGWSVFRPCLDTLTADTQVTTNAEEVAPRRKRITHLTARLGGGVRLDLAWTAPGAGGTGRYDLVVWAPQR